MPSRCIFFFSALRAWSTLLSRTRTCTRAPFAVGSLGLLNGVGRCARTALARRVAEEGQKVHKGAQQAASAGKGPSKDPGDVTHFAPRPNRGLAVEMHGGARHRQPFLI